jgi:glycerophosphoryl diester phosphodiesterase
MLTASLQNASATLLVLGHRGGRALYPENTQEGFFRALDAGIRVLELDLGMSKDGTLFIYHDTTINPLICTSPSVAVSFFERPRLLDLSDAQLETFDCGSRTQWWRFPRQVKIPGAKIPRFEQFLDNLKNHYSEIIPSISLLVEVKVKEGTGETAPPEAFVKQVSAIVENSGLKPNITIQSFSVDFLRKFKHFNPSIETALLWDHRWIPKDSQLKDLGIKVFLPKFSVLNREFVNEIREAGYPIVPWTLNSLKDWRKAVDWKLDGIITDDPVGLKKFLESETALASSSSK